ncbi:MAG TPA: hypothetical protein VMX17_00740 [Candidatus Glassbacteria bacterium]|nr:hypothetical protein [Candidatus Glassbacteria bacterium]
MVWTSLSPDGTKSVRTNVPVMLDNTEYTETTLNVDHYWNIGADEDGHHKQVKMPKSAADITLGTGIDGGIYLKEAASGTVQGYYRNVVNVYQFIPAFLTGTSALTSSNSTIIAVPNNTYGNIIVFRTGTSDSSQLGWFVASGGQVRAYSCGTEKTSSSSTTYNVKFANGSGNGLNIRGRTDQASADTYNYRITYWDI